MIPLIVNKQNIVKRAPGVTHLKIPKGVTQQLKLQGRLFLEIPADNVVRIESQGKGWWFEFKMQNKSKATLVRDTIAKERIEVDSELLNQYWSIHCSKDTSISGYWSQYADLMPKRKFVKGQKKTKYDDYYKIECGNIEDAFPKFMDINSKYRKE